MKRNLYLSSALLLTFLSCGNSPAAAGARLVADLYPGANGSYPTNLAAILDKLYFSGYTLSTGREPWKTDGSTVSLVADINNTADDLGGGVMEGNDSDPTNFTLFNGGVYFSAYDPRRGAELWKYDGATATRVTDISPDQNDTIKTRPNSAWPMELTLFNGAIYFRANSGTTVDNYELWKYNGSTAQQAANIHPDSGATNSSYPSGLTVFNGGLYFMADDGSHGYELWKHDGVNTVQFDLNPGGADSSSFPKKFTPFNNTLYFEAYSASTGYELWKTDGSTAPSPIDINPGAASSFPDYLTVFNGTLYFRASDAAHGSELWRLNGAQPEMAADINPSGDSYPKNLTVFRNMLLFSANDGVHGWELWKYDGTSASLVADLNPAGDAFPESFVVLNDVLYFVATTDSTGYEIFKYDGTTVSLAADVNPGGGSSYPRFLTPFGGTIYFTAASDGSTDWELWALTGSTPDAPPTVSLTAPANGAVFQTSDNITFSANAADDFGVTKVEFFANGSLVGAAAAAPYSVTASLPAGSYSVTAKATDTAGATTTSAAATISVSSPNQPPTVSLTSPANGAAFLTTDVIAFSANAADDAGVTKVEFLSNGTVIGTDTSAPYSFATSLAAGTYTIAARATDTAGAATTSGAVTITVGTPNQPPTVSLTSPANGATFLTTDVITFSANAADDAGVTKVEFLSNGTVIGTDTSAPYSFVTSLAAGTYTIAARATDTAGAATTSGALTITVGTPNQPPTVSLTTPANGAAFLTTDVITFSANAADDAGVTKVEFLSNGTVMGTDTSAPYSFVTSLAAGTYTIAARATDTAGATTTSAGVTITVGTPNQPPTVSLTTPANGAAFLTTDVITFSANAADDAGVTKVEFLSNGTVIGTDTSAPYSFATSLAAGTYTIAARATDTAGATTTSGAVTITVGTPNQPPTVSLKSPANGAAFLTTDVIAFSADAADDAGVAKVEFLSNGTVIGTDTSAPYSFATSLAAGTYTIAARATDTAGATTTSGAVTITVGTPNQPPTVSLTSPANGATFLTTDVIAFSANAADDVGITKVEFLSNGTVIGTDATAPYNFTASLPAGTYTITARAADAAGLTALSQGITITVNPAANQAPVITLQSDQAGQTLSYPATIVLTATASDPDGTIKSVEFFNEQTSLGIQSTAPFSLTLTNLSPGVYSFIAVATDSQDAKATSTQITVTIASAAPPKITSISRSGNLVQLQATAASGSTVVLEAATDLKTWTPIATQTSAGAAMNFTDATALGFRFYRLRIQ